MPFRANPNHPTGTAGTDGKLVARWTGANERTARNWFSGNRGPSGDHVLASAESSPAGLSAFLAAIHPNDCLVMADSEVARWPTARWRERRARLALLAPEAVPAVRLDTAGTKGAPIQAGET